MPVDKVSLLSATDLFGAMPRESLEELAARASVRSHGAGRLLFSRGDPGECVYVVAEGEVRLFGLSRQGQEIVFLAIAPPSVFGELALLDGEPRSTGARTATDTTLLSIAREAFRESLRHEPALVDSALRHLGAALRRTTELAADLALIDLPGRVAKLLVMLATERGSDMDLVVTQSDLAGMVGGSRQSVNQVLRSFERTGLLEIGRGRVVVRDLGELRRRADV